MAAVTLAPQEQVQPLKEQVDKLTTQVAPLQAKPTYATVGPLKTDGVKVGF